MKPRIYYTKPSITELELRYAADAAANGWGEKCYDYINRFEADFKTHLGVQFAIATSSCTGALHMGMAALGIGPGDEVIMADTNWIASASSIVHLGAKPVFVDILADSWCLDPGLVKRAITPRTKAIMAVHLYGNLCEMDALLAIGEKHDIPVIEDAAEAVGSLYHGKRAGSMGRFGSFSFHGTKTLTTGEGGMFVTNDPELYEHVLTLSNHGRARGQTKQFWASMIGFKYKISNIQAAIGCAQLERVDELVAAKRRVFASYQRELAGLPVTLNPEPPDTLNGCWMPTFVVDAGVPFDREALLADFQAEAIDGRVFFWPLSSLPMFTACPGNRIAYDMCSRACNLPSYHDLSDAEIQRVCEVVRAHVPQKSSSILPMPAISEVTNPDPSGTFKQLILTDLDERGFEIRSNEGTPIAYLKLIGADDLQDDLLIQQVTDWRRRHKHCFLSEFEPTCTRTKNWMQESVVNNPARALFRILSPHGSLMGHVGAIHRKTYIEYDYYILGVKPEVKNFALCVATQFLLWLLELTKLELISGNVRSDNLHGLDFHRRTGFSVYQQVPLRRIDTEQGEVRFEEQRGVTQSDYYLVEIRATAADLLAADLRQVESNR